MAQGSAEKLEHTGPATKERERAITRWATRNCEEKVLVLRLTSIFAIQRETGNKGFICFLDSFVRLYFKTKSSTGNMPSLSSNLGLSAVWRLE